VITLCSSTRFPKYDGDLGNPNLFVPLTQAQIRRKLETIGQHFSSQRGRSWFSDETFLATARLRGIGCNAPEGLAEVVLRQKDRVLNTAWATGDYETGEGCIGLDCRPAEIALVDHMTGSGQAMPNAASS
jgi:hypothetical protein